MHMCTVFLSSFTWSIIWCIYLITQMHGHYLCLYYCGAINFPVNYQSANLVKLFHGSGRSHYINILQSAAPSFSYHAGFDAFTTGSIKQRIVRLVFFLKAPQNTIEHCFQYCGGFWTCPLHFTTVITAWTTNDPLTCYMLHATPIHFFNVLFLSEGIVATARPTRKETRSSTSNVSHADSRGLTPSTLPAL